MKNESLIHIKFGYDEALKVKKDILLLESNFLRTAQEIKEYRALRTKEFKLKLSVQKKLKEIHANINRLHRLLPSIRIPKILEKHKDQIEEKYKELKKQETIKQNKRHHQDYHSQLQEIQEKLKALE